MTGPYPPRELVLSVLHGHEGGPTRGERRHFDEFVAGRLRQDRVLAVTRWSSGELHHALGQGRLR